MVSSDVPPSTRDRILDATLALIQRGDHGPVSMGAIAKAAGLSRQALYLIFADRADLYIALVRRVDEGRGMPAEQAKVEAAPDGVEALARIVAMQAHLLPPLRPIANAFDVLRRQDPDAERAWQDRLDSRYRLCRSIIEQLEQEGRLRAGLDVDAAADLAWSLTSFRTWDELVCQRGWSAERYKEELFRLLLHAVVRSPDELAAEARKP
jgi:AcrR family transcriptional regulator